MEQKINKVSVTKGVQDLQKIKQLNVITKENILLKKSECLI